MFQPYLRGRLCWSMSGSERHAVLTAVALVLGGVLIYLLGSDVPAATFWMMCMVVLVNAAGAILAWLTKKPGKHKKSTKAIGLILVTAFAGSQTGCADSPPPASVALVPGSAALPPPAPAPPPAPPPAPWRLAQARPGGSAQAAHAKQNPLPSPGGQAPVDVTASRMFLRSADIPPKHVRGYGVVALPALTRPDRLSLACNSFLNTFPTSQSLAGQVPTEDQMVTVWPLLHPGSPQALGNDKTHGHDCVFLVQDYDLYGGQSALRDAARQGYHLTGRGPFLIAWSPAETRGVKDKVVLVIDMSAYHAQASFDDLFRFWQQKIVADQSLWHNGFSVEKLRIAMNDFGDTYGAVIAKAIKF